MVYVLVSEFVGETRGYIVRCAIRGKCLQLPSAVTQLGTSLADMKVKNLLLTCQLPHYRVLSTHIIYISLICRRSPLIDAPLKGGGHSSC